MIKLCRNTLGDWGGIQYENSTISWAYFKELVNLQEKSGLHAGTKIRQRHINYAKEKMRVKLAAETFSASVADAIDFCNKDLNLPGFQNSAATTTFCRHINNIFDVLNTRNFLGKNKYKRPLNKNSANFLNEFVDNNFHYLSSLKTFNGERLIQSSRKTGFLGLMISLKSVQNLFNELVISDNILQFLLTYKLSQDHLEMFFSAVRSRGGFNNNPTAFQFESAYKRLLVHCEIKSPDSANCLAQDATILY